MATVFPLSPSPSAKFFRHLSSLRSAPPTATTLRLGRSFPVNSLRSPATDPPPAVQSLWQWLCDEGVVSAKSPVRPALVPEGLGLVAVRDIARNDVVLEMPKRFWINPDTVAASEIGNVCGGLKPWISICLFLIRERSRVDSPWRSYLDILPDFTNSTIYWSEEELSELQGTQLLSTTLGVKEFVQNEFMKVEEEVILPNKQLFPSPIRSDDFLWAFGMLRSRAFSRLRGQHLVLIPLADLVISFFPQGNIDSSSLFLKFKMCMKVSKLSSLQINHSPNITTEDYAWEIKGAGLFSRNCLFSLRTPVFVKAGEQVLIQYDLKKSNAELALDYGFIESRSDRHTYTLTLEISESDPFFGDKLDIAESNGLGETAYFDVVLGCPLPPEMLPYLRLVALGGTDAFLLESIFSNSVWGHLELPVSRANEELICQVVRDACKSALSSYHTTIEQDKKLKEEGNLGPRLEIAVEIRAGEKKVLHQIDGIFKDRELELDTLEYYHERRLKDLGLVGEQGEIIFWEPK